jgi:acyl-CoA thioester hydrolase
MSAVPPPLDTYPLRTTDTIRFGDTDRQGHVNNAAFATYCESGRVAFLYDPSGSLAPPGCSFVIARLTIDFRREANWPGTVEIGTRILTIGRSSFTLAQGLFQGGTCFATAESVLVLMDHSTRKSTPLPPGLVATLEKLGGAEVPA